MKNSRFFNGSTCQPARGPVRRLLVETEFFKAFADYQRVLGGWSCIKADPPISWLKHMEVQAGKIALLKMGAHFEFVNLESSSRPEVTAGVL